MTSTTAAAGASAPPADFALDLVLAAAPQVNARQGLQAARQAVALARSPHDRALAGAWVCTHLMRLGHHAELLDEASRVLPQLSPPDLAVQRRELLRCITLCGSEIGAFDVALDAAQQLAHDSRTADDTEATLTASYSLAVCLERMGDSWQAQRLLREALAGHEPAAPSRPLLVAANAVCAMAIGMVHRLRGASTEADLQAALQGGREHGELALRLLAHVNDPVYEIAVPGNLGEVLLLQGHLDEARSLLQRSLDLALTRGLHAYAWRVQTSMADWMLAVGQPLQADRPHWICWAGWAPTARSRPRFAPTTPSTAPAARSACSSRPCTTWKCLQTWSGDAPRANCGRSLSSSSRTPRFSAPAPRPNGDQLTGLENRRHLARRCAELLPQAARDGAPLSLALLDLDDFEKVNDPHGHAVGDQVLVALAQLLRENTRAGDVLTRHSGEEFVIVLPGMPVERALGLRAAARAHPGPRVRPLGWPACLPVWCPGHRRRPGAHSQHRREQRTTARHAAAVAARRRGALPRQARGPQPRGLQRSAGVVGDRRSSRSMPVPVPMSVPVLMSSLPVWR